MTTPIEFMTQERAYRLFDLAADGNIKRNGDGFRRVSEGKRAGNRHHSPTLLERLADQAFPSDEKSYDPRPQSLRGRKKRAGVARAVARQKAEQRVLEEFRRMEKDPAASFRKMLSTAPKLFGDRLKVARGLA